MRDIMRRVVKDRNDSVYYSPSLFIILFKFHTVVDTIIIVVIIWIIDDVFQTDPDDLNRPYDWRSHSDTSRCSVNQYSKRHRANSGETAVFEQVYRDDTL